MAADSCTLEILNCTPYLLGTDMTATNTFQYQMDKWQFTNVARLNFTPFGVKFLTGSNDEDDNAWQQFTFVPPSGNIPTADTGPVLKLQGLSAARHSIHSLSVVANVTQLVKKSLSGQSQAMFALATNAYGTILEPVHPNDIVYRALSSATGSITVPIGEIEQDDDLLGVALIELSILYGSVTKPDTRFPMTAVWNDLGAGNLSAVEEAYLYSLLRLVYSL